ncbi:lipid IV(A) 3-deoxy-D-manno-octulosonic acid transferase [Vibrio fluvialis]|jgi:3-deoxy-D-manno-octulosonic-acid transferase|uniref:lipid IV(A) 3-deoxy-D-manno-octulosonic acid transferase n=1 Tax=Vibrio fluvialis TaxID=676 RepID=UPI00192B212E|nr:lipid IV(A) 3-deoxy-D-manno-octulosonic acid transferase [Vibrio fluvialis]EKO3470013.1 lipid IV(A) 3-deoxy-D-manno-octulosonic acid transferase [Vibrio fluvialis]MBL4262767.1 lipid IV(A) 3-deoxy-D-manno-octulosonic acid transferase [Vibrio fluvialis]MBY7783199.1 lipid IV(A) 3-deoxy-D-manno-octulosonic acid transferase [Vibrio fluvialis]MBY7889908.1 lipid IV(A) 3-deoxy-D-manno-octulosonic acid transferase [Vibrio fluvialis]MBY8082946.1 lipid IV(A) 3-deoxy-D-manno-octulosonic acid transferas
MRLIYTLLLIVASPLLLYSLYKKKVGKPAFGARWKEHWGITPKVSSQNPIWIHAVSVGESIAAIPVIKAMKQAQPDQAIVVTTTTSTGAEQIAKLGDLVEHRYMPLDFAWCVRRFLQAVKPSRLLIVETELWPNTVHTVHQHNIPITIINARLSERSCLRYQKFSALFNLIRPYVDRILCQYESDAKRFIRLGFQPEQVQVTGSIKFDIEIAPTVLEQGKQLREELGLDRPVWIAASTHDGEDTILLDAHQALLKQFPNALLILVPRHPERFNAVFDLCIQHGFTTHRRTSSASIAPDTQIYLGDTMGELLALISAADICFMGGSLIGDKVGGHNLLEPAVLGKPLLNGPSYYNFNEIMHMLQDNGAVSICENASQITDNLQQFWTTPQLMQQKGINAQNVVRQNRGAISRTVANIALHHD